MVSIALEVSFSLVFITPVVNGRTCARVYAHTLLVGDCKCVGSRHARRCNFVSISFTGSEMISQSRAIAAAARVTASDTFAIALCVTMSKRRLRNGLRKNEKAPPAPPWVVLRVKYWLRVSLIYRQHPPGIEIFTQKLASGHK